MGAIWDPLSASAKSGLIFVGSQNNVCGQLGGNGRDRAPLEDSGAICMGLRADLHPGEQVQLWE